MRISYPVNHKRKALGGKSAWGKGELKDVYGLELQTVLGSHCTGVESYGAGRVTPSAELMKYRLFVALLTMYLHLSPSLFQPPSPC